jgi:hypothetical protein
LGFGGANERDLARGEHAFQGVATGAAEHVMGVFSPEGGRFERLKRF